MLLLSIRTDKPEAEIGLFDDVTKLAYEVWHAHRQLGATLLAKIEDLLKTDHKTLQDVQGIICFEGPGSFTGLRIGLTVGNTLAYALSVPIIGARGENWILDGQKRLARGEQGKFVLPHYGAEPHITTPKK